MTEPNPILGLYLDGEGKLLVRCKPQGFESPYKTGVILAMAGRIIVESIRQEIQGNPNLREQAEAEMTRGFVRDMEIPGEPPAASKDSSPDEIL